MMRQRELALRAELGTLTRGRSAIETVLPALRELVGVESILVYGFDEHEAGAQLGRFLAAGPIQAARPFLAAATSRGVDNLFYYDVWTPRPDQRNTLLEAKSWITTQVDPAWTESRVYREILAPIGVGNHRQVRSLVCDGPSMLAWFGAFHPEALPRANMIRLARFIPAMQRALTVERQLAGAPATYRALDLAIDQLGGPALVVGRRGAVLLANQSARVLDRAEVSGVALDIAKRKAHPEWDVVELVEVGASGALLAIRRPSRSARVDACVEVAVRRHALTTTQARVLTGVASGLSNEAIAATLSSGRRAVEHHVTKLLARFGAATRAALVASVLLAA